MTIKTFSSSTTITTALAISLCSGAFWLGGKFEKLQSDISHISKRQQSADVEAEDWRKQTASILSELKQLGRDNKMRLDYLSKEKKT